MSVFLQAPWDLIQTTIKLPSPNLGNLKNRVLSVNIRNSISGVIYSYVKTNPRVKLSWDFYLDFDKAHELQLFVETYNDIEWRVTTWEEEVFKAILINDPDFSRVARGDRTQVRLEFEGVRIDV